MAARGKSINMFLMDGSPTGRIKVTLANWTGVAYKIPRTELEKCKDLDILKQSGVYFLFGTSDDSGESVVYIGQAGVRKNGEGLLYRLQEHKRNPDKDYWTEAVMFTTSNNSFGPTEISYLENRFCFLANEAKRYEVKNGNDPTSGNITEEKESELEEFIDYAKIVMGTLGHKVFEPLTDKTAEATESSSVVFEIRKDDKKDSVLIKGVRASDGFVLLKGSKLKKTLAPSLREGVKALRTLHSDKIDEGGILLEDLLLRSPNEAANFALGYPVNALTTWLTSAGKTLKDVESSDE
jgi:hypothetical protein